MDGVQLSQGYRATKTVYFLPLSPQEVLVLILPTSEELKDELTLEPYSGFLISGFMDWESSALTTR